MTAPANHWKLGLFVVLGAGLALLAVLYFGTRSLRRETVTYKSYFDEAVTALELGAPVRFRGVTIGNVSAIDIAPDGRHVGVSYQLGVSVLGQLGLTAGKEHGRHTRLAIPKDLRAQLGSTGVTGVKYLLIDFFDPKANPVPQLPFPTPRNYIPAASSTLKNLEDSVMRIVDQFPKLADQLVLVLDRSNQLLGQLTQGQLPERLAQTLGHIDQTLSVIQTKAQQLDTAGLSGAARTTLLELDGTMTRTQRLLDRLGAEGGMLSSLQRASDSLGDVAGDAHSLGPALVDALHELRDAADGIRELSGTLESQPDMLLKGRARVRE